MCCCSKVLQHSWRCCRARACSPQASPGVPHCRRWGCIRQQDIVDRGRFSSFSTRELLRLFVCDGLLSVLPLQRAPAWSRMPSNMPWRYFARTHLTLLWSITGSKILRFVACYSAYLLQRLLRYFSFLLNLLKDIIPVRLKIILSKGWTISNDCPTERAPSLPNFGFFNRSITHADVERFLQDSVGFAGSSLR